MAHRKTKKAPRRAARPASAPQSDRDFAEGEIVRIEKKSVVVDRERAMEGLPPEERIPIEQEVTGYEGEVCGGAAPSRTKEGTVCYPVRVKNGAVVIVPEDRLERPRSGGSGNVTVSMSAEAWERIFGNHGGKRRARG